MIGEGSSCDVLTASGVSIVCSGVAYTEASGRFEPLRDMRGALGGPSGPRKERVGRNRDADGHGLSSRRSGLGDACLNTATGERERESE